MARSTDPALHYRHPPASAFQLNKVLYRVRMDEAVRRQFMADPDSVIAEYRLSPDEVQAVKELDVNRLSGLGAHPLLAFMARFNVEHDRRSGGSAPSPQPSPAAAGEGTPSAQKSD